MLSQSEQSSIARSLENILADEKFAGSPQMSAFLRYVVTETLKGNADRIKAYTVAVDALGKSEAFDPQNDPSVRVLANRLRNSLDQYYERTGNHEKIIEIKAGSYKPIFSEPEVTPNRDSDVTRIGCELPGGHHTQSFKMLTDKAPSNQASIKPGIASSGHDEKAIQVAAVGGNVTASSSVSISNVETINGETTLAVASQERNIPDSSKPVQQQADAPVSTTSVKDQKHTQPLNLNYRSLVAKLISTVQVHKLPSGAMSLVVLATLIWGFNNSAQLSKYTDNTAANNQEMYALQLASATSSTTLRQRPAIPTVIVRTDSQADKISQSLLSSISHVLSKFDHLQVLKSTYEYELAEKWPEDYEIVIDTFVMNDANKITVILINSASGRISYSDELFLYGDVATKLSKNNIAAVELFIARIVQKNGPLLLDYKNHKNISETMACVFSITDNNLEDRTSEGCLNKVISQGQNQTIQNTLRAEISLKKTSKK